LDTEFPDDTIVLSGKSHPALPDDEISDKIIRAFNVYRDQFNGKKISIVVNDITRRIPTEKILKVILGFLSIENIEILTATGTHDLPSKDDLKNIFGDLYEKLKSVIHCHDCNDKKNLVRLGETSRGTPVEINNKFFEAEAIICINSVEPHFFAGFTGGRKSIIPGLAGLETVIANHSLAKSEKAQSLNLADNPVHLDLEEAVNLVLKVPVFSIQLVISRSQKIIGLFCGDISRSFYEASEMARDAYSVPVDRKFDIVFAIGEAPLDVNLYQLQKAQEHGAEALADGGILIVVGACEEGVGSPYFSRLADDYPTPESALSERAMRDKRFGIHKLVKTARRLQKIKIRYITKLDDNVIRKVYFDPIKTPRKALKEALEYFGGSAKVAVLKDACYLVPVRNDVKGGM